MAVHLGDAFGSHLPEVKKFSELELRDERDY